MASNIWCRPMYSGYMSSVSTVQANVQRIHVQYIYGAGQCTADTCAVNIWCRPMYSGYMSSTSMVQANVQRIHVQCIYGQANVQRIHVHCIYGAGQCTADTWPVIYGAGQCTADTCPVHLWCRPMYSRYMSSVSMVQANVQRIHDQ